MTAVGTWKDLDALEDPNLRKLAAKLPDTIVRSHADSTVGKYLGAFRRWEAWATKQGFEALPARDYQLALYLQHLRLYKSKAAVEEACNALAWVHSASGLSSPSSHPFVRATSEGLQRMLAKPVTKNKPESVELLGRIVEEATMSNSLSDICLATACQLSLAGFLRFNDIRPIDVKVQDEFMTLHLPRSKTDQLRKGDELMIARTRNATCPVAMLELYMRQTHTAWDDQQFLFRPICKSSKGERLRESGCISYSCLRDLFKRKLEVLGEKLSDYGIHSLRAGGATAAANLGVADRFFKSHGRWRSKNAKDGYVEDTTEQRLGVSRNLGL